ncbi:MAG: carboxy terminal-processing peptidase [SAR86 cluster bacterium]|uniref:Carboxy terminal-processing peptidase n=1 Tax=SAR86 cluster bacterium TaxID=2030880 RepID=A0A838YNC0_9GAMM|nr:carboxy terminal-processing peptidase [SAR86 cluster bacterium]
MLCKNSYIKIISLFLIANVVYSDYANIDLSDDKELLTKEIILKFQKEHYVKNITRSTSNKEFIISLLDRLDDTKSYFLKHEVEDFIASASEAESTYDFKLAFKITNLFYERLINYSNFQINLIENNNFDLLKAEKLDIFEDDNKWLADIEELKLLWKKQTKNDYLSLVISDSPPDKPEDNLVKRYKNRIKRVSQQKEEDIYSLVTNVLTKEFDPHSSYLSPKSSEDFDMDMSLKLEGIGALLGSEDDYTKIVSLVPGGPAEKSGLIKPEDKVIGIRQGEEEIVQDVVGWRIDDVVDLIRGKSGTKVEIEFLSSDSLNENIKKKVLLTREEVKLEDRAVKSEVLNFDNNIQIGVIDLPSFYMDFNAYMKRDPEYKSSSRDIKNILLEFNKKNVDAVILDLRSNGGGALDEANKIISLFIERGPTVQVKLKSGYVRPWGSQKNNQVWQKPLIVLVNRYSASASEIVAAAIQDYKRGIVVGQRTFGKGTVQSLQDLSEGAIKVTESKYYRINGKSVQNKGVTPDIEIPATWDIESIGESSYPTALEWDTIRPYRHQQFAFNEENLDILQDSFVQRLDNDPNLKYLKSIRNRYDLNKNKKFLSLNIEERKNQKRLNREWMLQAENLRRSSLGLEEFASYKDFQGNNEESDQDKINLEKDLMLQETINIAKDFIKLDINLVAVK